MRFFAYKIKGKDEIYTKRAMDVDAFLNSFEDVYKLEKAAEVIIGDNQFENAELIQLNLLLGEREIEVDASKFVDFESELTSLFYIQMPVRLIPIEDLKERIG